MDLTKDLTGHLTGAEDLTGRRGVDLTGFVPPSEGSHPAPLVV